TVHSLSLHSSAVPLDLHSFPTRRSSDLERLVRRSRLGAHFEVITALRATNARKRQVPAMLFCAGGLNYPDRTQILPSFPFGAPIDRKSTRLNSSHRTISYAVFCLKKKNI